MVNIRNVFVFLFFFLLFTSLFSQSPSAVINTEKNYQSENENQIELGDLVIDFAELSKNVLSTQLDLLEYVNHVYSGLSDIVKPEDMKIDLGIKNWNVVLSSSARQKIYILNSKVEPALVKKKSKKYGGETILGVKILFPSLMRSSAMVVPPFSIPFFSGENGRQFIGKGVVDNVKTVKEIKTTVYSLGHEADIEVLFEDMNGREYVYPLGSLKFKGWSDLIWSNPNYISGTSFKTVKDNFANYPLGFSKMRFKAFRVFKKYNSIEQNLIFYVKDIRMIYDKLNIFEESDIDSESIFKIYEAKGFEELKKLKSKEALKRILRIREDILKSKGSFAEIFKKMR